MSSQGGAFYIYRIDSVILNNLTVKNGNTSIGGAIYIQESNSLTILNSLFTHNLANAQGGVIFAYNLSNYLDITNSNFLYN